MEFSSKTICSSLKYTSRGARCIKRNMHMAKCEDCNLNDPNYKVQPVVKIYAWRP
jgi:hypothetical protein